MEISKACSVFFVLCGLVIGILAQSKVEQSEDGSSGTIKFSTPDLHDDEAHSPWMPNELRCDACKAVTFQLWKKFSGYNEKRKSLKYKLPESDILDLVDDVCENTKTWDGYGLKELKPSKEHRLVGEGLFDHKQPGVITGGGFWPGRLRDMCEQYAGDLGELLIYNQYKRNPKTQSALEDYLCRGQGLRGDCIAAESKDEL